MVALIDGRKTMMLERERLLLRKSKRIVKGYRRGSRRRKTKEAAARK